MRIKRQNLKLKAGIAALLLSTFVYGTGLANAQTTEGYKAGATSAAGIFLEEPDALGKRQVSLSVSAKDVVDCSATFSNEGFWARICDKVTKDGGGPQSFVGTLQPVKGNLVLEGIVARPNGDFQFMLGVLLRDDGSILAVNTMRRDLSELSSVFFDGSRSDVDKAATASDPIIAELISPFIEASVELGEVNYDGKRNAKLEIIYKSGNCAPPLANTDGWLRICEIASKDGPYSISGLVEPLANDRSAFTGLLKPDDDRRSFRILVSQARDGFAVVGLRERDERTFRSANAPENVIFGGEVPKTTGDIDLSANDWRVETESIAKLGANIEISFQKLTENAYTGSLSIWFPPEANAYCPQTSAMLKICESVDKDGPLPMTLGFDRIEQNVKYGFAGTAQVPPGYGVNWGSFNFDLMQGSSIGDWGDEEPNALYIRFTTNEVAPGSEPVGWLKIVPLDRPRQQIDGDRKLASINSVPAPGPAPTPDPNNNNNSTNRAYIFEADEDKACNKDLDSIYQRAVALDGSHVRMSSEDWNAMLQNFYENTQNDIARFVERKSNDLVSYCQNAQATLEAWINNTNANNNPLDTNGNNQASNKPVQCQEMDRVIASLRAANGVRSDGSVIANWDAQLRFVDQFLRALPPDPRGTGQSCAKGIEVVVALLSKLGIDQTSSPNVPPQNNPTVPNRDQPNGGTFCETLARAYSQIGSVDEQNRAREILLRDNRFGTWKLPSAELSCQVAGELFAQNKIKGF